MREKMIPIMKFDSEIKGQQHAVIYTEIRSIAPVEEGKRSVVNLKSDGKPDWLTSSDPAHQIQARWEGFYATKEREEKEPSKPIQEFPFESDIASDTQPEFAAWWNSKREHFKSDSHHMNYISEMILHVAGYAWDAAKAVAK